MADAPEIKVKLTAEDTGVSAAIKELTSQLKNLKKQQDETAQSGLSLKSAFQGIVAAGAALEFGRIGKDAFDSAVNIGKMADKTGLTTQTLSVFHKVAGDVGASTEAVDKGLIKAARSIDDFQAGGQKAARAFQTLGISQKDFVGLNSDQKIQLVTQRLGTMEKGFGKANAQQLIFGRGGSDLTLVLNSLAAQGFDKATEATSKLGLLLNQETTDDFRAAKASMQELQDVGKGMATQFEAGLLPAISDVGEALVDSLTQGGVSFKDIGKAAGDAVRGIALVFLTLGQTIGTVAESAYDIFHRAWELLKGDAKNFADVASLALKGKFSEASDVNLQHAKQNLNALKDEFERQKAIFASLGSTVKSDVANLFPSDEEEAKRRKERISRLRPDKTEERPTAPTAPPSDAAARAALALLEKQLQDELTIHRAYAKQTEQIDKEMYDAGEISLKEYFDRRRAAVISDADEEIALVQKGLEAAKAQVSKATQEKNKAATPKDADKQEAARLQALQKVDELETKITLLRVESGTKVQVLNDEQFKGQNENLQKVLEFHKLIDTTQGKTLEAAKQEIQIESQKMAIILAQAGESKAQIDAEIAKYTALKTAASTFEEQQKAGAASVKDIEDQKAAIQDKVANGQLFEVQAQQQIRDLEQSRLPALQAIADQLVAQAKLTGDIQKIQAAEDFQKQVNAIGTASNQVGQQVATLKQGIQSSLTGGIEQFFGSLLEGTRNVGQAFRGLAASVLDSLAKMAIQMVAQIAITKLLKSALGGFSGGGIVPSVGGGVGLFAEGGLIRGAGGPKSDSIPARVSPGEYIVKADSVAAFGVQNLEAINRGLKIPSLERLALPKFADGGLVGNYTGSGGSSSNINLGIGLDEGLILKHLSSKAAGNIILQHLTNNPKAAQKALSRSS